MESRQIILIVEDCSDIAALEADIVLLAGHDAIVASDGIEALAKLATNRVDVILLDLNLPWLDGQAVLDHLTTDPRLSQIPVIVVSANLETLRSTPQVVEAIRKPFELEGLVTAIERSQRALVISPGNEARLGRVGAISL